jgi:peptidoglycan/LPS O-acetylase OafA/YrhL
MGVEFDDAKPRPATLRALTGLRAIAALWVVAHHLRDPLGSLAPQHETWRNFLYSGHLGVDVFAVLSGFVISLNYAENLARPAGTSRKRFVWLRAVRILPLHWFMLIVMAFEVLLLDLKGRNAAAFSLGEFALHATMLHGWGFAQDFAWNVPSWTVSTEWLCYLAFTLAGPLLTRITRGAAAFTAALALLALTGLALTGFMLDSSTATLHWAPLRIGVEFAAGCLLWVAWRRGFGRRWSWPAISVLALLGLGASAAWNRPLGALVCSGLLVYGLAHQRGAVASLLASRFCYYWGEASYSIYLVHWPVIRALRALEPGAFRTPDPLERAGVIAFYFAVILAVSTITYHLVEAPSRKYLRKRIRDPQE